MWLALILTLPTDRGTRRQRIWRALRSSGAAVLRDGVYLMPERAACGDLLDAIAEDVRQSGGTAFVLRVEEPEGVVFRSMFDRTPDYLSLQTEISTARADLRPATLTSTMRRARRLRKSLASLVEVDFFPGDSQQKTEASLQELEMALARVLAPDEPRAVAGNVTPRVSSEYHGRIWATRRRPWIDRLASAWLISRFIDHEARFMWLETPSACPPGAVGFDFDGATFTHVGDRVTFEVLMSSFSLERAALLRIGQLVHALDVGGPQPGEAAGVEMILAGLRSTTADDGELLTAAMTVFDGLMASFSAAEEIA